MDKKIGNVIGVIVVILLAAFALSSAILALGFVIRGTIAVWGSIL